MTHGGREGGDKGYQGAVRIGWSAHSPSTCRIGEATRRDWRICWVIDYNETDLVIFQSEFLDFLQFFFPIFFVIDALFGMTNTLPMSTLSF